MPIESRIKYNPTLSVYENAEINGVSVSAIRYYIRTRGIDRRYDVKVKLLENMQAYINEHPNATRAELQRATGHGINTIRRYWDVLHGDATIEELKSSKVKSAVRTGLNKELKAPEKVANGHRLASEKLKEVADILQFAEQTDIAKFREWLLTDTTRPLICIGNGGNHTTYPALLYQMMASVGKAVTPLEFATISPEAIKNSKVLLLSNSGRNLDIKYATKRAAKYNKDFTACITFSDREDNAMVKALGMDKSFVFKNHYSDGFISIRSKILTYGLLYKAFSGDTSFAHRIRTEGRYNVTINKSGKLPRWENIHHFNLLYGSYGEPVAHDIESTMVEGSISSVQMCDYRNFCHGRFIFGGNHCANKKVAKTDVCTILLITPREEKLAQDIRDKALADNMPIVEIRTEEDSPLATIQLLIDALTFVFDLAEKGLGINPNSPKNYSKIDKRVPINSIPFAQDLARFGELHYTTTHKMVASQAEPIEVKPIVAEDNEAVQAESNPKVIKTKKSETKDVNSAIRCTNEYVYFYQDTPLSNWWVSEPNIPYDGLEFTSSEALFMYLKAKVFRDDEVAVLFPKVHFDQAKELGKLVRNFNEDIWIRERKNAMYIALKAKLAVDEAYRETLLSDEYAGKTFVEASPYDGIWGIKRSINDAYEGKEWQGLNLLGELHTIIRDELLGLREPQDVCITPIEPSEIKPTHKPKSTISKNIYPTEGEVVRSILGGIIGDIAGSSREGYSRNTASPRVLLTAQSRFTDDSAMTIALADWFNNKDKTTAKECFVKWFNKYPHAGFGKLFSKFVETGVAQPSNANGGAMRVAPCAIVAKTLDEAMLLAEEQCKISHTTDIAINGAKAIAAAIFIAKEDTRNGKSDKETKAKIKSFIESNFGYDLNMTLEDIQERSSRLEFLKAIYHTTKIESDEYLNNNMSSASLSCPMAIMAFLLGDNYEESIRYALAMGGDADSIACMAGSISAQMYGIPQQLVNEALVYLPTEMVDVLNKFESSYISPSRVTPPHITSWIPNREIVVYGSGEENNEQGIGEVTPSRFNHHPLQGYPIPTIGRSLEEIKASVATFIEYAKQNPDLRFHTRKVGYDKAGYTIEQIAPLFNGAKNVTNILLPKDMLAILNW